MKLVKSVENEIISNSIPRGGGHNLNQSSLNLNKIRAKRLFNIEKTTFDRPNKEIFSPGQVSDNSRVFTISKKQMNCAVIY